MPSAVVDFELSNVCAGGNHATLTVQRNAVPIGTKRVAVADLKRLAEDSDEMEAALAMAVEIIKAASPATLGELKTLIGNMTITLAW